VSVCAYYEFKRYKLRLGLKGEVSREFGKIICPSSEYVHGVNGFQMCPVCRNNNKLWKDSKNGSETAKQLYRQFKRKLNGYALVFMINDPVNPENNGKVKIVVESTDSVKTYVDADGDGGYELSE
jgi:hypothetical protein